MSGHDSNANFSFPEKSQSESFQNSPEINITPSSPNDINQKVNQNKVYTQSSYPKALKNIFEFYTAYRSKNCRHTA